MGKVRKENEDSVLVSERLFAVADGMGGHKGGKQASETALKVIADTLFGKAPDKNELITAMEAANRRIYDTQLDDEALKGMGTTLSIVWANETEMLIGHVGDSRVYLIRHGEMTQVTQDHSLVAELMKNGYITAKEAEKHPYKNVITRSVGTSRMVLVDAFKVPLQKDDKWLICSDGLHNMLDTALIREIIMGNDMDPAADKLLATALDNGGADNISFILLDCGEDKA